MGKSKVPYPNATHLPQEIRPYEGIIKGSWMIMVVNHPFLFCGDTPGIGKNHVPMLVIYHPGDVPKHPKDVRGFVTLGTWRHKRQ